MDSPSLKIKRGILNSKAGRDAEGSLQGAGLYPVIILDGAINFCCSLGGGRMAVRGHLRPTVLGVEDGSLESGSSLSQAPDVDRDPLSALGSGPGPELSQGSLLMAWKAGRSTRHWSCDEL